MPKNPESGPLSEDEQQEKIPRDKEELSDEELSKTIENYIAEYSKIKWDVFSADKELVKLYSERSSYSKKDFRQKRDELQETIKEKKEKIKLLARKMDEFGGEYKKRNKKMWQRVFRFPELPSSGIEFSLGDGPLENGPDDN